MEIRRLADAELSDAFTIINDAAGRYRGVIPADRWHEPYLPMEELTGEIARGVEFWAAIDAAGVVGVMGMQDKGEVALVRHAYVATRAQRKGIGTRLLRHVLALAHKPVLIGTWADATWAIDFYRRNGFTLATDEEKTVLLRRFWSIPERQVETSVVLADARWSASRQSA